MNDDTAMECALVLTVDETFFFFSSHPKERPSLSLLSIRATDGAAMTYHAKWFSIMETVA